MALSSKLVFVPVQPKSRLFVAREGVPNVVFRPRCEEPQACYSTCEAMAEGGCFVFLHEPLYVVEPFESKLDAFLEPSGQPHMTLIWIRDSFKNTEDWQTHVLKSDSKFKLTQTGTFQWRNFRLVIPEGTSLDLMGEVLDFSQAQIEVSQKEKWQAVGAVTQTQLLLYDSFGAGLYQCDWHLSAADSHALEMGFRYIAESTQGWEVFSFPFFEPTANHFSLEASMDILNAENPNRQQFNLARHTSFVSAFRSTQGNALTLCSLLGSGFALTAKSASPGEEQSSWYWTPKGSFQAQVDDGGMQLMCGLSGLEFFTGHGTLPHLIFKPDCAALVRQTEQGFVLSPEATTAHLAFEGETLYCVQPESNAYFNLDPSEEFLQPFPLPAARLLTHAVPMVPLGYIDESRLAEFESDLLQKLRQRRVLEVGEQVVLTSKQELRTVTSNGLLMQVDALAPEQQNLLLARDVSGKNLSLFRLPAPLKKALQTNQAFVVISDPSALEDHLVNGLLNMGGWHFDVAPDVWEKHQTIMIMKYSVGRNLSELVDNLATWNQAHNLNRDVASAQGLLRQNFQQAQERFDAGDEAYRDVLELIHNPNWSGILFLNVMVPFDGLPEQIRGLAAGIDPQRFQAHHLGIHQSAIQRERQLQMQLSSMFGLVDYQFQQAAPTVGDYAFRVERLQARFQNTAVTSFTSVLSVTLNRLFDERCTLQDSSLNRAFLNLAGGWSQTLPADLRMLNNIYLKGSYLLHNGLPIYVFRGSGDYCFTLESQTLASININRASFNPSSKSSTPGSSIVGNFAFQGTLGFKQQATQNKDPDFDLFSLERLAFSHLNLNLSYDPVQSLEGVRFDMDYSTLEIDRATAKVRKGGLANQFPLTVERLITQDQLNPSRQGFVGVTLPHAFKGTHSRWFALRCVLDLGSPGDLAANLGFTAEVLLAWTPGRQKDYPQSMMIKLPLSKSGGRKSLSLEGFLKLKIKKIELLRDDQAYQLLFNGISLKFLAFQFPPADTTDLTLFGNPDPAKDPSLGWYAAYAKHKSTAP